MKKIISLLFFLFFVKNIIAQQYHTSKDKNYNKTSQKLEKFISKIQSRFKSSQNENNEIVHISKPVLVHKDPNRNSNRIVKWHKKNREKYDSNNNGKLEMPSSTQKIKSFSEIWNIVVNGKGYTSQKNYNQFVKNRRTPIRQTNTQTNSIDYHNSTNNNPSEKTQAIQIIPSKNIPIAEAKNRMPIPASNSLPIPIPTPEHSNINNTSNKTKIIEDKTNKTFLNNNPQDTTLTKTISGKANYFFSGTTNGKFYTISNLVAVGKIIKIINPTNGNYIYAEVIENFSKNEPQSEIILRISDNAKKVLDQKQNSFNVKVVY